MNQIYRGNKVRLRDVDGSRVISITTNTLLGSVFISGPGGFCVELPRADFVAGVAEQFDLVPVGLVAAFAKVA